MSSIQFLRILWARRFLIFAATVSCVAGAIIVLIFVPPRWEAHSRVMLNNLKPDPVTGEVVAGPALRGYVETQIELITDYTIAGHVIDQMGWLSDPVLAARWRASGDPREFRRWLAQLVVDRTKAKVVQGSNILEITYASPSQDNAARVADTIRKAYIETSLNFRRSDAERGANWFDQQAQKAKASLDAADAAKTTFERENGIVMADDKTDVETARLRALSTQGVAPPAIAPMAQTASPASIQLAQIDSQIAQASQTLGPNHPQLQQLRAQRASVAALVAQDRAAARSAAGAAAGSGAGAIDRAVALQKSRIIAQGDKLQRLTQLQAEVDLRRDQFDKTSARAAELHQQAAAADTGLTPLGDAVTPKNPAFPNMPLILIGSLGLGLATGVLVALLAELLGRRVRGFEDLQSSIDAPVLAVIGAPLKERRPAQRRGGALANRPPRRNAVRA